MTVVTRFPPSPTGFMHIGNARTALFNWLYARHHGGKFLMRIEDTDRERHSEEAVQAILNGMSWLGLDRDNEEIPSQFESRNRHAEVAMQLLEQGKAYYCYCSPEELEEMRVAAREEGRSAFYDRRWREKHKDDAPPGVKPVVRIKAPLEGETIIEDKVQGLVRIDNRNLDDFILLRSDGTPTYMLAVVVDDHDMEITHVIRGDDHLNNTFRQKIIYDAMGWELPVFAHLPLIHGPDGGKFSKRHGATSVEEYRDMGFLPEAMCNYLLRLGWSHGDDEIISREQAIEWFDLPGVGKSPARFDFMKLENLNAHYIKEADDARLYEIIVPLIEKNHGIAVSPQAQEWLRRGMNDLKQRVKTTLQLAEEALFYCKNAPFDYDAKAKAYLVRQTGAALVTIANRLEDAEPYSHEIIEKICRDVADEFHGGKLGQVAMPFRAALTGTTVSPPIFMAAFIMGREETLKRLREAIAYIRRTM